MNYCKKCARIVDGDVTNCPFCGEAFGATGFATPENNADVVVPPPANRGGEPTTTAPVGAATEEPIAGSAPSDSVPPSGMAPSFTTVTPSSVENVEAQMNELQDMMASQKPPSSPIPTPVPAPPPVPGQPPYGSSAPMPPYQQPIGMMNKGPVPQPPSNPPRIPEPEVGMAAKIMLIVGSILLAPIGIIGGIVYMGRPAKSYRQFGQSLLIIGITMIVLVLLCCCISTVFGAAIFEILEEIFYGFYY